MHSSETVKGGYSPLMRVEQCSLSLAVEGEMGREVWLSSSRLAASAAVAETLFISWSSTPLHSC
jgi:hypothetical protein